MKFFPVTVVLAVLAISASAQAAPESKAGPAPKAKPAAAKPGHIALPTDVRPERYDIRITPDAAHLKFSGHEAIALEVKAPTSRIQLNAADIAFQKASLSGESAAP